MKSKYLLILIYALWHSLLPLSYYIREDNKYDERFAWRMLSNKFHEPKSIRAWEIYPEYDDKRNEIELKNFLTRKDLALLSLAHKDVMDFVFEHLVSDLCKDRNDAKKILMECWIVKNGLLLTIEYRKEKKCGQ